MKFNRLVLFMIGVLLLVCAAALFAGEGDMYKQVMTIDESGTSRIEKFGHWLSRGRYCRIILDGETKQWTHGL